jgi:hypothetical protein
MAAKLCPESGPRRKGRPPKYVEVLCLSCQKSPACIRDRCRPCYDFRRIHGIDRCTFEANRDSRIEEERQHQVWAHEQAAAAFAEKQRLEEQRLEDLSRRHWERQRKGWELLTKEEQSLVDDLFRRKQESAAKELESAAKELGISPLAANRSQPS